MKAKYAVSIILVLVASACASSSHKICGDHILFSGKDTISFNKNEELLACGDPSKQSWKEIPLSQSEYHLKTFLETRAYYHPTFVYKNDQLLLDPGTRLVATSVDYTGAPAGFEDVRIRKILDEPLNPDLLNYIEASVIQRLKDMGYACPTARAEAIKETGAIHVTMQTGPQFRFGIPYVNALGLYGEAMRRFDAFSPDDPFRYEWLKLSENRAENDGIVVSSEFAYACPQSGPSLDLDQVLVGGDKRLLSLGAGASTEEIPIFQASWKNVRTDENGSAILITLYGSQRDQRVTGTYFYHPFKNSPRFHIDPSLQYERDHETTYRSSELQASAPLVYQFDYAEDALKVSAGPAIKRNFSDDANLNKAITLLSLITDVNWFTHHYELYATDPQQGTSLDLNVEFLKQVDFAMLGTIVKFSAIHLWKLNSVYPTQWVLGFRYGANTTFVNQNVTGINQIPAEYLHTLGGDQNIRGFGRNELTANGIGAHTSTFGSLELRYAKTLPLGIEPFGFFDFGALGLQPTSLDKNFYYSPGIGVRWETPFGAIRSTLAHGYVAPTPDPALDQEHFQFFISFGREF